MKSTQRYGYSISMSPKNERNDWVAKVRSNEKNIARKALSVDIPRVRKGGRPKNSWAGQMRQQQQLFGLTDEEKSRIASSRPVTRSMTVHPRP